MKGVCRHMGKAGRQPTHGDRPPIVRTYDIGGTRYVVTATVRAGVTEDAAAKVRRLIRREIGSGGADGDDTA
jgi:hypothetical protein